jgi:hypothetical protein
MPTNLKRLDSQEAVKLMREAMGNSVKMGNAPDDLSWRGTGIAAKEIPTYIAARRRRVFREERERGGCTTRYTEFIQGISVWLRKGAKEFASFPDAFFQEYLPTPSVVSCSPNGAGALQWLLSYSARSKAAKPATEALAKAVGTLCSMYGTGEVARVEKKRLGTLGALSYNWAHPDIETYSCDTAYTLDFLLRFANSFNDEYGQVQLQLDFSA